MTIEQIINLCKKREQELLDKYYGNLVKEATLGHSCYIIDPAENYMDNMYGFEHIKSTAVAGIDILKERLITL